MKNFMMAIASIIFIFAAAMMISTGITENKEIGTCVGYPLTYTLGVETSNKITEHALQEDEAINTYYVDTGNYKFGDFSTATIYEFDTRTGEWSDGGNYVIHGGNLCEVNKYGERTKIGRIIVCE